MKTTLLLFSIVSIAHNCNAQSELYQYFDGADTSASNSIVVQIDTTLTHTWQVGPPQKGIFNAPASSPNVLVTDTINYYQPADTASFNFSLPTDTWAWGVMALQWMQKIDYRDSLDGGMIEFSLDDTIWENAFNNPYVYNFYGYDEANVYEWTDGAMGFTGTDTSWKNIWLCFDYGWLSQYETLHCRFTHMAGPNAANISNEGWMIDNMMAQLTIQHTLAEKEQQNYIDVFPVPTTGRLNIRLKKMDQLHIIEEMELLDIAGHVARHWGNSPPRFFIEIGDLQPGTYYLRVRTNVRTELIPIIVQ